jgi:hypothetical protein
MMHFSLAFIGDTYHAVAIIPAAGIYDIYVHRADGTNYLDAPEGRT